FTADEVDLVEHAVEHVLQFMALSAERPLTADEEERLDTACSVVMIQQFARLAGDVDAGFDMFEAAVKGREYSWNLSFSEEGGLSVAMEFDQSDSQAETVAP